MTEFSSFPNVIGVEKLKTDFQLKTPGPSDRAWGMSMGSVAILIAFVFRTQLWAALFLSLLAAILIVTALSRPSLMSQWNRRWMKLGNAMAALTNPIFLGALFFIVVSPLGLVRRLVRGATLGLKFDRSLSSYWILREAQDISPESLRRQF